MVILGAALLCVVTALSPALHAQQRSQQVAEEEETPASPPSRDTTGRGPAPALPPPPSSRSAAAAPAPTGPSPVRGTEDPPAGAPQADTTTKPKQPLDGGEAQQPVAPGDATPPVAPPVTSGTSVIAPRPPAPDDQAAPAEPGPAAAPSPGSSSTAASGTDPGAPLYFVQAAPEAVLANEIQNTTPPYLTVEPQIYVPVGETRFKVRPPPGQTLSDLIYLRIDTTWIDPVTPPEGSKIKQPDDGLMVLTELYGEVKVRHKDNKEIGPNFHLATEGLVVPSGTEISTGEGSSVAVVLHGLQSTRIGPSTSAIVRQGTTAGEITTDLNLIDGTVFVRVGGREGAATFRVRTPVGIAEARGSDFAVWYRKEKIVVCSAAGRVALTDLGGRELVTLEKYEPGTVNIAGIPTLDLKQKAEWLYRMLSLIKKLNGKSAALIAERDKGVVLSDREQKWLKSLHPITYYLKAKIVRTGK
ncbi:MAG: FecR domain-containing protein [Candidatus Methylacidiphilales bacterium]